MIYPQRVVSIVVPTYNHAHFLPIALESILAQSQLPREVLIVDDASEDDTVAVIEKYQRRCGLIGCLRHEANLGPVETVNQGVKAVRERWVALCAADDVLMPECVARAMRFFQTDPSVGMCCGDRAILEEGAVLPTMRRPSLLGEQSLSPSCLQRAIRHGSFFIPSNGAVYRRDLLLSCNGYEPGLKYLADWYINLKIGFLHGVGYVSLPLGVRRKVASSYQAVYESSLWKREEVYRALMRQIDDDNLRAPFAASLALFQLTNMVEFLLAHPCHAHYLDALEPTFRF